MIEESKSKRSKKHRRNRAKELVKNLPVVSPLPQDENIHTIYPR
jgi:hypothetical protein